MRESARLFHEKGYEQTTVDELATAMGVSVGALYRYVSTKSDALVMVCDDIYSGLPEELQELAAQGGHELDVLRSLVRCYVDSCLEHRDLVLLMYREFRHLPREAQERSMQKEDAIVDVLAGAIRRAQRSGHVRKGDARLLATHILLLGHLPALKGWQLKRSGARRSTFAARHTEVLLDGLRSDAG